MNHLSTDSAPIRLALTAHNFPEGLAVGASVLTFSLASTRLVGFLDFEVSSLQSAHLGVVVQGSAEDEASAT